MSDFGYHTNRYLKGHPVIFNDIKSGPSEKDFRSAVTEQDGIISPNKRWLAFVGRHIYGPEDVIILGTSTSFQVDEEEVE